MQFTTAFQQTDPLHLQPLYQDFIQLGQADFRRAVVLSVNAPHTSDKPSQVPISLAHCHLSVA
jgi:hypothetical protein